MEDVTVTPPADDWFFLCKRQVDYERIGIIYNGPTCRLMLYSILMFL